MKKLLAAALFCVTTITLATEVDLVEYSNSVKCLAEVIYRESRGEPFKGKLAVGQVVMNRVNHPKYPKTVCKVIFQPGQFSWVSTFKDFKAPEEFRQIARNILAGTHDLHDFNATHFHARYVAPRWQHLKRTTIIGNHIFYTQL